MNRYEYGDLIIEVFNEQTYTVGSVDNKFNYSKCYFGEDGQIHPTSKHGIKIFRDGEEINDCIIIGSGGATGIYKNSSVLDQDQLVICCCNTIFSLTLPALEHKWQVKADWATCFEIFKLQEDYIIHGELEISRIDRNGIIKWQFGGPDIFVSLDDDHAFELNTDHISVVDFYKTKYKLDFDGKLL